MIQNIPVQARLVSYTWSEPLIRGFYDGNPAARGNPWKPISFTTFKGAVLVDGKRMANVWTWREALKPQEEYWLSSLDQTHGNPESRHVINLLFSDHHIELITCDEETLRNLQPY